VSAPECTCGPCHKCVCSACDNLLDPDSRLAALEQMTRRLRLAARHAQNKLDIVRLRVSDAQRGVVEGAASYVLSTALSSGVEDVAVVLELAQARWRLHVALNAEAEHITNPAE
jgi:hypothetical protein